LKSDGCVEKSGVTRSFLILGHSSHDKKEDLYSGFSYASAGNIADRIVGNKATLIRESTAVEKAVEHFLVVLI
jgi:hypothetical protein